MTQEATQIEVPNFEATTAGKKIFTPKQWLERFCDAMMHVLKDSINLKYSELLTKVISRCNLI